MRGYPWEASIRCRPEWLGGATLEALMDERPKHTTLPWDLVVFATVALIGLGYAVQRLGGQAVIDATPAGAVVPGTLPVVELGCVDETTPLPRIELDVTVTRVRLRGRFCGNDAWGKEGNPTLSVRNLSSGTSTTIIFRGDGTSFVTDELVVQRGANPVVVEWRKTPESEVAVREAQLDVQREPATEASPTPR